MKKTIILGISVLNMLFACKKEENKTSTTTTLQGSDKTKQSLSATTWKLDSLIFKQSDTLTKNSYSEDCERDDAIRFFAYGNMVTNYGALKCDADEGIADTMLYEVRGNGNGDSLNIVKDQTIINYKIVNISATRMELNHKLLMNSKSWCLKSFN